MADEVNLEQQLVDSSRDGSLERVRALLDQGVDINSKARDRIHTCLSVASRSGHEAVVSLLCERGADVNAVDRGGFTSLTRASQLGHFGVVKILVAHGADVHQQNEYGWRPLHFAAIADQLPICEFLLSKGADLMAVTSQGWTALKHYGRLIARPPLPAIKAYRSAALEAAWAAGPHPSQVQRRRDECWFRRGPLLWVLAEHGFCPLQHRALALALAAASLDCARPVQQPPSVVALMTRQQLRHEFLLGRVFSIEGIVRLVVSML